MCVPIGHVFVFQVNTCLFSDERTCVCVCPGCAYICVCVFTCTHVCVPIRHTVVFQENTCLLSDEHSCVSVFSARA